ncbi:AAA family ATPase [Photobacterium phosphoreum]|uniref:AAA family ATPase n=1 Tax=Photobacterium phosphoreum TaxID=659 RepID=UPI0024B6A2C6|nr:AAA family ATPase [Photobacterium phosphoreum]
MKITSLTVGGFKGIKNKATIPLAPITLFFGANSTGKSTVLHALLYLYEVIAKRNFDAKYSSIAGESLYFGGFQNLVHGKDLDGVITLGATLDFRDGATDIWDDYLSYSERRFLEDIFDITLDSEANTFSFEIDIKWDNIKQCTFISRYVCKSAGIEYFKIEAKQGRPDCQITNYNPLLNESFNDLFEDSILFFSDVWEGLSIQGSNALPNINERLDFSSVPFEWSNVDEENPLATQLLVEASLSQITLAPLKLLVKKLEDFIHIGPLRIVPSRSTVLNKETSTQRWYDGTAGWETFAFSSDKVKVQTNKKFESSDFFGTNYRFEARDYGEVSLTEKTVILKDFHTDIPLLPSSVGVGVSQVFPFVVATSLEQDLIVSCEQPELHIHPKWQLALGDMMVEAIKNNSDKMFLIETHSEHLMLRLLRRTAEDGELSIKPDDVSVINVFKHDNEIHYQRQRITDNGDFELDWPEGFFEERYGEA